MEPYRHDPRIQQLCRRLHNVGIELTPDQLMVRIADWLMQQTGECPEATYWSYVESVLERPKAFDKLALLIESKQPAV